MVINADNPKKLIARTCNVEQHVCNHPHARQANSG